MAGLATTDEFMSGKIHHALSMAPGCNNFAKPNVYPSTRQAGYGCPAFSGAGIPHGSRIWSDLKPAQVDALGLDTVSTIVLKALNEYGGFVTDTNGWLAFDVRNIGEGNMSAQSAAWWKANSGESPALNMLPASFFTSHFHVLQTCVTQGNCSP